jgi:glycosyltransferase involved in cell wall biosynthesis
MGASDVLLPAEECVRARIASRIANSGAAFHISYGVGARVLRDVIAACSRRGVPCFLWAESLQPRPWWDPRRLVRDELYRRTLRYVAGAFAVSPAAARDFEHLGVPRSLIFPAMYPGPERSPLRPERTRRLVYCGRLIELKGLDVLAEGLLLLAREGGGGFDFDVVGDGPLRGFDAELRRRGVGGSHHGAVPSERVATLLAGAAALVLPTRRREGWGYVVNEAYAVGTPVVVSDVVGAREIVVPGRTGEVFASGDARSLAAALRRALSREGRELPAIDRILDSIRGEIYVEYVRRCVSAALAGGHPPVPPWHSAVASLGGNPEVAWWKRWRSGELA